MPTSTIDWPVEIEIRDRRTITYLVDSSTHAIQLLHCKEGDMTSWHIHEHKSQQLTVLSGLVWFFTNGRDVILHPGETIRVDRSVPHCFAVISDAVILESYIGADVSRDDIVRRHTLPEVIEDKLRHFLKNRQHRDAL